MCVCVCRYKLFLKYPDALRAAFPRLKDKLEDEEPAVQVWRGRDCGGGEWRESVCE